MVSDPDVTEIGKYVLSPLLFATMLCRDIVQAST